MAEFKTSTVPWILATVFWASPVLLFAADDNGQSLKSSTTEDCQMTDAAHDAINRATDVAIKNDRISMEALDLIDQAEWAAGPPECDNDLAIALANEAFDVASKGFSENPLKPSADRGSETSPETMACKDTEQADEAINKARKEAHDRQYSLDVLKLIWEAEAAVKPPECDSARAKILADKAIELASQPEKAGTLEEAGETGKTDRVEKGKADFDKSEYDSATRDCFEFIEDTIDFASNDPYGFLFTTAIIVTPVTSIGCFMTSSIGVTVGEEETAQRKIRQLRFVAVNRDNLTKDMSRGRGEYITAMAHLQGCAAEIHESYAQMAQRNFSRILPQPDPKAVTVLSNLEIQIANDPFLAEHCFKYGDS